MVKYVAFLRAINVGGKGLVKMEVLRRIFESLALKNVRTYIQSGNVVFESPKADAARLTRKIEKKLQESLGHEVAIVLTTAPDLSRIVKRNPFKRFESDKNVMFFVTFLASKPTSKPKLPVTSRTENLDVFAIDDDAAFIIARRKPNGWFGFPNNFAEKQLGVFGTTRTWTTVRKIVDFAEKE